MRYLLSIEHIRFANQHDALFFATLGKHKDIVEVLLKLGLLGNGCASAHTSPLHIAAAKDCVDMVSALSNSPLTIDSINKLDEKKRTPMHVAVEHERFGVVKKLLESPQIDLNIKNYYGDTPLETALYWGLDEIVDVLVQDPRTDASVFDAMYTDSEWMPCAPRDIDRIFAVMLKNGIKINLSWKSPKQQANALHFAAKFGNPNLIFQVLELLKTKSKFPRGNDQEPFVSGRSDTKNSRKIENPSSWGVLLASGKQHGIEKPELVKGGIWRPRFLRSKIEKENVEGHVDFTAQVNAVDHRKNTPLHYAVFLDSVDCVSVLLRGAKDVIDVNAVDSDGTLKFHDLTIYAHVSATQYERTCIFEVCI